MKAVKRKSNIHECLQNNVNEKFTSVFKHTSIYMNVKSNETFFK